MRERLATVLAILLSLGILVWATWRERATQPAVPQQVVWRMLEAARNRDLAAYLSCFGGDLEQRLRRLAAEMGEGDFVRYLDESAAELEGVALFDVASRGDQAQLTVELVYARETERQALALRREGRSWKIVSSTAGERRRSLIPHGTPIEELD